MENDWVIVFTTENPLEADMIKGMLKGNDIESVIINKRDSSYGMFGEAYVYVYKDNMKQARELINETRSAG